ESDVTIWRDKLVEKSGNADFDYDEDSKKLSWEISVNKAGHPIENAVLYDTIPAGLNIDKNDIKIEGAEVDPADIVITLNADGTPTVMIPVGDIDSEVKISYTTEVTDFEQKEKEDGFTNAATLKGEGIGEENPNDK